MSTDPVPHSVDKAAFSCPHCRALTTQYWFQLYGDKVAENSPPGAWKKESKRYIEARAHYEKSGDVDVVELLDKLSQERPFFEAVDGLYVKAKIENFHVTTCYHCQQFAIWVCDKLIWPTAQQGPHPNLDLPAHIKADYDEAGRILNLSPRGAAALLRLCIQKLCMHLGEAGISIDADIASLIKKGLPDKIGKALDIVRVVGNEAVHPGELDLKDDYETAYKLFELINIIADYLITQPKKIDDIFETLPTNKKEGIFARNIKALSKKS